MIRTSAPFPEETINPGPYRMAKGVEDANTYRVGHPLAQRVLARARELEPEPADVVLDYAGSGKNIAILEPLRGRSGWLACAHVSMSALESEDQLVFAGVSDDGEAMDQAQCRRLFDLPAEAGGAAPSARRRGGGARPYVDGQPSDSAHRDDRPRRPLVRH